ncbi:hypothetical protein D9757_005235 [Collybiopsis confluens]|uniref:F-box domain-containing protein n=1 Tax=Collybiopsis confluens TaxID=2823264 RepID=A0A8H5ME54_9AGAR|nr:hypothetical protein D9757_005235 [Collybiopsis confluens]
MFDQLPTEIWWGIFEYLCLNDIIRLSLVNHAFLEMTQQLLYRKLDIVLFDEKAKSRLRTIRSSSLGHHIRYLYIRPTRWSVSAQTDPPRRLARMILSSTTDFIRAVFDPGYVKRKKLAFQKTRMNEQIQLALETMKTLDNVPEYWLIWQQHPSGPFPFWIFWPHAPRKDVWPDAAEATTAFLSLLDISPFRRTLTKLTLRIPSHTTECLPSVDLPSLEDLNVALLKRQEFTNAYPERLAIFISSLSMTLRILSLSHLRTFPSSSIVNFPRVFMFSATQIFFNSSLSIYILCRVLANIVSETVRPVSTNSFTKSVPNFAT